MTSRREIHSPPPPGYYPWLLYIDECGNKNQTFCTVQSSKSSGLKHNVHNRRIPELHKKKVFGCFYGWLILSDAHGSHVYTLWNPETSETMQLPRLNLKRDQKINFVVLSTSPRNPDSVVLLFRSKKNSMFFCRLGEKRWREFCCDDVVKDITGNHDDELRSPVSCNGKFYALTNHSQHLLLIDFVKPNKPDIRSLHCPLPIFYKPFSKIFLIESRGELFAIYLETNEPGCCAEIVDILLLKLDLSTMNWEKLPCARDRVFFLDNRGHSVVSCYANEEGKDGSYLHFFRCHSACLYSYNMEDKTISMSLPCPNLWSKFLTRTWIMPESRLIDGGGEIKRSNAADEKQVKEVEVVVRPKICIDETMFYVVEKSEECRLVGLPSDVIRGIAAKCTILDYLNFRAVSKFCRAAIPLSKSFLLNLWKAHSWPWLVQSDKDRGIMTFIDPKFGHEFFITIPEPLGEAIICTSKYCWLLLLKTNKSLVLFNPFTRTVVQLPESPITSDIWPPSKFFQSFTLSGSPEDPEYDCPVLVFTYKVVMAAFPGDEDWQMYVVNDDVPYSPVFSNPIYDGLECHFLDWRGRLGLHKTDPGSWEILAENPVKLSNNQRFGQHYIVECGEDIVSVFVGDRGEWVRVFKLMKSKTEWEEINTLGNYMIYVGGSLSFSAVAEAPEMANKIYFPRLYRQHIVFYSLDTCRYHTFGSEESLTNFCNTKELLLCGWIDPSQPDA